MTIEFSKIYKEQYCYNQEIHTPYGRRKLINADYIASGQNLKFIERLINKYVLPTYGNIQSENSHIARQTISYREEARNIIKRAVNASEKDSLIFTGSGCTSAIDLLARRFAEESYSTGKRPLVILGPFEHHSNILIWREGPFDVKEIPLTKYGNVDVEYLEDVLNKNKGRKVIGSFSAASNITGIIAPIYQIHTLLKKYGAISCWDYAGAGPYLNIDMNPYNTEGIDAIFLSPHKFMGGPGSPGVLIVKKDLFADRIPTIPSGGTAEYVTRDSHSYHDCCEIREEGGTPDIIGSIRAGLSFHLKESVGFEKIMKQEKLYVSTALNRLNKHKNIKILGSIKQPRIGVISFQVIYGNKQLHYNLVTTLLNDLFGIQARGGCSCAAPYGHKLLDIDKDESNRYIEAIEDGMYGVKPGWIRINFNYFIPKSEFNFILTAIEWIASHGWRLLDNYHFDLESGRWKHKTYKKPLKRLSQLDLGESLLLKFRPKFYFKKILISANRVLGNCKSNGFSVSNTISEQLQWFLLPKT